MTPKALAKIKKWVYENHTHHALGGHYDDEYICEEGEYPYVNSLELEKFLDSLVKVKGKDTKESILIITDDHRKAGSWLDEHPQFSPYTSRVLTASDNLRGYKGRKCVIINVPDGMKSHDLEEFMYDNIEYKENQS